MKQNGKQVSTNIHPAPFLGAGLFSCAQTNDGDILRMFYLNPMIWDGMQCDGGPNAEDVDFDDLASPSHEAACIFVTVDVASALAGLFMFHKTTPHCYDIHSALLPAFWGHGMAHEIGKAACWWLFENTECQKVTTSVPEYNEPARRMAMMAGMRIEGCNRASFMKHGILYDQLLLGFTKEELLCQL
jgi:RimJ/RimL family protein N-acetyltransferase